MKNRDYKLFSPGSFFHVYNRGTGQIDIFKDSEDFKFFLFRLKEALFPPPTTDTKKDPARNRLPDNSFSLICYALMPNHFHLVIRQNSDIPLSKLMLKIGTSYSKYFNKKHSRIGSLFQDQYKAILIDNDEYLRYVTAYVHQNPILAGLVKCSEDYPYSSYLDYAGIRKGTLCDQTILLDIFNNDRNSYIEFINDSFDVLQENKNLRKLLLDA